MMPSANPEAASGSAAEPVDFSLLVTCFYEEKTVDEFHRRAMAGLQALGRPYEIIFVNDGSHDGTWDKIRAIMDRDPHVSAALDLSKNFGQSAAVTAALCESRGRAVILMDSDLQLSPEELPILVKEYDKGFDLVTGYRVNRKDSLSRILPSKLANIIMRRASHSSVRDFGCTFKVYNGALLRAFGYGPQHIFSNVEVISRLDRIAEVPVSHRARPHGKSGWTFQKLFKYNMDNVVILSEHPFQFSFLLFVILTLLFLFRLAVDWLIPFRILKSVSNGLILNAIVVAILLNIALLSVIGEFTIRAFLATRRLPLYLVREAQRRP
jgi:glycosyltransferase involved in cell wall biosynthesis